MTVKELRDALGRVKDQSLEVWVLTPQEGELTLSHAEEGVDVDGNPGVVLLLEEE